MSPSDPLAPAALALRAMPHDRRARDARASGREFQAPMGTGPPR